MSDTSSDRAFHTVLPPSMVTASKQKVVSSSGTGSDVKVAIFSMTTPPKGKVYVTFEAVTNDFEVSFGDSAITTAAGSLVLAVGQPKSFWISPTITTHVVQKGVAGSLRWYVSSPEFEGTPSY